MFQRIGRYEITAEIGRGGFGKVYRARDPFMNREVAIKVLTRGDDGLIDRFKAEASTVANLHHKNIVTTHDFGEDHGAPFLVMEYLDGTDLDQVIASNAPLSVLDKVKIMTQAADGLQFAHARSLVHRDVKPANIMMLRDGTVKILDFGIARLLQPGATRLTQAGFIVGTLQYMAPELFQAEGGGDALSDVWSFGVVYYEILSGLNPFKASDPMVVLGRVQGLEPAPLADLVPGCPNQLSAAVHKLLAKDRDQRYQSLEDLLLDTAPMMRELVASHIEALQKEADHLIKTEDVHAAQVVLRQILELDPSNLQARHWRDALRNRARRRALQPRLDELIGAAEAHAANRDFVRAIEKIDSALQLDPDNATLRNRLDTLRSDDKNKKRADRLAIDAQADYDQKKFTGAHQLATEALSADPSNRDALLLIERVEQAKTERAKHARLRAQLANAKSLMLTQYYSEAIAILTEIARESPEDEGVGRRLAEARDLENDQHKRERIETDIGRSRTLIKNRKYDEAISMLRMLAGEYPDNAAVRSLLDCASDAAGIERKAKQIDDFATEASIQCDAKSYKRALELVRCGLDLDPESARLLQLRQSVLRAQQEERRNRAIPNVVLSCRSLIAAGELDQALAETNQALLEFTDDATLIAIGHEVGNLITARQRCADEDRAQTDAVQTLEQKQLPQESIAAIIAKLSPAAEEPFLTLTGVLIREPHADLGTGSVLRVRSYFTKSALTRDGDRSRKNE